MEAYVNLYEPKHDHLKVKNKRGQLRAFVYVVEIGAIVKICPSQRSADNYLKKLGYVLSDDCTHYYHKYKSEDQINLERNYIKAKMQ